MDSSDPYSLKIHKLPNPPWIVGMSYGAWVYMGIDPANGCHWFRTFSCYGPTTPPTVPTGVTNYVMPPAGLIEAAEANIAIVTFDGNLCGAEVTAPLLDGKTDAAACTQALKKASSGGIDIIAPESGRPLNSALETARDYLAGLDRGCSERNDAILLFTSGGNAACLPDWVGECVNPSATGPAGLAQEYFSGALNIRTFVYAMGADSPNPSPADPSACESNQTAYYGGSNSALPDAGWGQTGHPVPYDPATPYAYFKKVVDQTSYDGVKAYLESVLINGSHATSGLFPTQAYTTFYQQDTGKLVLVQPVAEFPSGKGHLYFWDLSASPPSVMFDAADSLNAQAERAIYTWDPRGGNALFKIGPGASSAELSAINAYMGGTLAIDDSVRDFIIGSGPGRWRLGPPIFSKPAVVGPAAKWGYRFRDSRRDPETGIEILQQNRHQLVYVGSSDGMLHAFDAVDGAEVFAVLPPDLLDRQVLLKQNYESSGCSTGQPISPNSHIYGVCNSPTWTDVPDSVSNPEFATTLYMTEGAGGDLVAALDVNHPYPGRAGVNLPTSPPTTASYPPDNGYDADAPFSVRWFHTGGSVNNLPGLGETWSVPAVMSDYYTFTCLMGNLDEAGGNVGLIIDAWSGTTWGIYPTWNCPNCGFADGVLFRTDQENPYPDTEYDLGIEATLDGKLVMGYYTLLDLGPTQPLYYSPALAARNYYSKNIYAFASGSYFSAGRVAEPPTIYIAINDQDFSDIETYELWPFPIGAIERSPGIFFSPEAQVTSKPFIVNAYPSRAYFLVYDPLAPVAGQPACFRGDTFLVMAEINLSTEIVTISSIGSTTLPSVGGVATGMVQSVVSLAGTCPPQDPPQEAGNLIISCPQALGQSPAFKMMSVEDLDPCVGAAAGNTSVAISRPVQYLPQYQNACEGGGVSLSVNDQYGGYQWFKDYETIEGATDREFMASQTGLYYVEITDAYGCTGGSSGGYVYIVPIPKPVISGISSGCSGAPVILSTGTFRSYQWLRNGVVIAGATNQTYSAIQDGNYTVCVVGSNTLCYGTSPPFSVSFSPLPTPGVLGPSAGCSASGVTLATQAFVSCQWMKDGAEIAGASGQSYTATLSGNYSVRVTDASGCSGLSAEHGVLISDNPAPAISGETKNRCPDAGILLSSEPGYASYQWKRNGASISGATASTYKATLGGSYSVSVASVAGCEGASAQYPVIVTFCPASEVSPTGAVFSARLEKAVADQNLCYIYFQGIAGAGGYNLYEGRIGKWYSHADTPGNRCGMPVEDLGTGEIRAKVSPPEGNRYYIITAFGEAGEGPSGFASSGAEIPKALSTCPPLN